MTVLKGIFFSHITGQVENKDVQKVGRERRRDVSAENEDEPRDEMQSTLLLLHVIASNRPRLPAFHLRCLISVAVLTERSAGAFSHDALVCMTIKTRLCRDLEWLNNSARPDLYRCHEAPQCAGESGRFSSAVTDASLLVLQGTHYF